jgi:hypothetical protein
MAYYLLHSCKFNQGGVRTMAKVSIKFLTAHIADNQVEIFLKKMEEVLKDFSGDAYNFRHEVEWASSKGISKIPEERT